MLERETQRRSLINFKILINLFLFMWEVRSFYLEAFSNEGSINDISDWFYRKYHS
jgi:hypothetical protein